MSTPRQLKLRVAISLTGFALLASGCAETSSNPAIDETVAPPSPSTTARASASTQLPQRDGPYRVSSVSDGDTVWVIRNGQRSKVRIIGINTAEVQSNFTSPQCFGPEASAAAKQLLLGRTIWLERDPSQDQTDRYGRELAYIWVDDREDFGLRMIQQGYAYESTYRTKYRYQTQYREAEAQARQHDRGLWSPHTCDGKK